MTLDDYVRQQETYVEFAATVVRLIESSLRSRSDISPPMTSQSRAKDSTSLRNKLSQRGLLYAESIESEIKDLAGCRLIFYTNSDADRFLQSRIVFDNFVVDWDNTKIHHPIVSEPKFEQLYRARHYIIALKSDRLALPEYARFTGMRAELQIQTLLNHAWSETAHEFYKGFLPSGFGSEELEAIKQRMARIMTKYLIPAGYEFDKVQHDTERLRQGKALFERKPIEQLENALDNNERCDILERLGEELLPLYDDKPAIYGELLRVIPKTIVAARTTATKSIETGIASFPGRDAKDVADAGIEILTSYRYLDAEGTLLALCQLWDGASEPEQKSILAAVERLAEHNLQAWQQVGCGVQLDLMRVVAGLSKTQLQACRSIIVSICRHVLEPTVRGTTSSYAAATFHARPVAIDDALKRVRSEALDVLETLFKEAAKDDERRAAFSAMMTATAHPSAGSYSQDAISLANGDSRRLVRFVTAHHAEISFELLEHIEYSLFWLYRQSPAWFAGCEEEIKTEGLELKDDILLFRDTINADQAFVTYKTLVGFEAVFLPDWEAEEINAAAEDYRLEQVDRLVSEITPANAADWLAIIRRCASTSSDDGATFLTFAKFLQRLARSKPSIILGYLQAVPLELEDFLVSVLDGLDRASRSETQTLIRSWIEAGKYLPQIGRHLRLASIIDNELLRMLAKKAVEVENKAAVREVAVAVVARDEFVASKLVDEVFIPAVRFLTQHKDVYWLSDARFQRTAPAFFAALRSDQVAVVLDNLIELPKVNAQTERVIAALARATYDDIWQFFGRRIRHGLKKIDAKPRYEAIPYQFFEAQSALSANADHAVDIVHAWYKGDDTLFQFRGGRLVAIAFPGCPTELSNKLISIIAAEGEASLDFVSGILIHYHGAIATHPVCQAMVNCLPENDERLLEVRRLLQNAGMVQGEFGMVEAYERKVREIQPWQNDERPKVRYFAIDYAKSMQQSIAAEHSRAEQSIAMRKLEWDADLDDASSNSM